MKKFMMMVAMAFATLTASAQAEVGTLTLKPLVGMNLANVTKLDGNSTKVGIAAGAELEYMLSDNFSLSAGAIYSQQGTKFDLSDEDVKANLKLNMDYINVPILANYYVAKGFAIKAGIQAGFKANAKCKLDMDTQGMEDLVNEIINPYTKALEDAVKGFELSIPVGLSYEISDFVIDARYNFGVTKVADGDDCKNSVFQFTVGYKFAL